VALFDEDGTDSITFDQFVSTLSNFHPSAPLDVKHKIAFAVYDVDGDGM
jgi:Ca2+-binding EF-hand superfamily protein